MIRVITIRERNIVLKSNDLSDVSFALYFRCMRPISSDVKFFSINSVYQNNRNMSLRGASATPQSEQYEIASLYRV